MNMNLKNSTTVRLAGKTLGKTHGAHETRHLSRKMNNMRQIPESDWKDHEEERAEYAEKICNEITNLTEKVKMVASEAGQMNVTFPNMPTVNSLAEARKYDYSYVNDLKPQDFIVASKLALMNEYSFPIDISQEELLKCENLMLKCLELLEHALAELIVD